MSEVEDSDKGVIGRRANVLNDRIRILKYFN